MANYVRKDLPFANHPVILQCTGYTDFVPVFISLTPTKLLGIAKFKVHILYSIADTGFNAGIIFEGTSRTRRNFFPNIWPVFDFTPHPCNKDRLGTQHIAPNLDQGEFTHHWTATSCPHDLFETKVLCPYWFSLLVSSIGFLLVSRLF